jgi:ABC-2 type transport system ATP-binding protein
MVEAERDNGASILYTTHYMEEAERLCDSVAIIDHGKLISQGTVVELRAQLGARDVLQLRGTFPAESAKEAVHKLVETGIPDLEMIAQENAAIALTLTSGSQHLPAIFSALSAAGANISETNLRSPNLETLFLLLTGKELRE